MRSLKEQEKLSLISLLSVENKLFQNLSERPHFCDDIDEFEKSSGMCEIFKRAEETFANIGIIDSPKFV